MKTYLFCEPHYTGGNATIEITEDEILKYMRRIHPGETNDKKLIDDFIIVHWAYEKGKNNETAKN